ncbi:MAG TPA: ferritin family protein [Spirochaetia bacterium]|nr:ferritin family protein [Spirochaetia bacterium]
MDILSFGMQMELDGKVFYQENAEKVKDKNIRDILKFLADEEQKHYDFIKRFRDGSREVPDSRLVEDVQNVFVKMREENATFLDNRDSMIAVLHKGLDMEDKSVEFYTERADQSDNPDDRDIFLLLKKQEDKHYSLLSSMIEFYDRPNQWLEQAEFTHLEEY